MAKEKLKKSPIRYFGGKGMMLRKLLPHIPEYEVFVEPFCGSAVMALNAKGSIVINDLNLHIYNFFRVMNSDFMFAGFRHKVELIPYHEKWREDALKTLEEGYDKHTEVEMAVAFFTVNRLSRNGWGGFSIHTLPRRDSSKAIADFEHAREVLDDIFPVLKKAIILNQDGIDILPRFDKDGHFIYCDPPYHHDTRSKVRYDTDMSGEDHERLISQLLELEKAQVMVSGYDHEVYNQLVNAGWHKHQFDVNTYSPTNQPKKKVETIWMNYESPAIEG